MYKLVAHLYTHIEAYTEYGDGVKERRIRLGMKLCEMK